MKRLLIFAIVLAGAFTMIQCTNNRNGKAENQETQIEEKLTLGTKWLLSTITIDSVEVAAPVVETEDEPIFITFSDSTQFNGFAGCNYFFGVYNMEEGGMLELLPQGSTRMSGKNLEIENAFLPSLEKVKSYTIKDSTLILKDIDGKNLMVFNLK